MIVVIVVVTTSPVVDAVRLVLTRLIGELRGWVVGRPQWRWQRWRLRRTGSYGGKSEPRVLWSVTVSSACGQRLRDAETERQQGLWVSGCE